MAKARTLNAPRTNNYGSVRVWFSRFNRMSECEHCGYDAVPEILVLHHRDRDRSNNALSNLEVLCPNCHSIEHMAERKTKWKGHVSSDYDKRQAEKKKKNES
jgi:5-methylcytosine-specific restriction endonuclease McrA